MKKKILIVFLCVFGLFCGLTCFAAEDPNPPSGYELGLNVIEDATSLNLGVGTGFYAVNYNIDSYGFIIVLDRGVTVLAISNNDHEIILNGVSTGYYATYDSSNDVFILNNDFYLTGTALNFDSEVYVNIVAPVATGNLASEIVDVLSDNMSSVKDLFLAVFTAAVSIFYNNGLTVVGYLALIGLAIMLLYYGIRFIKGLINKARAR